MISRTLPLCNGKQECDHVNFEFSFTVGFKTPREMNEQVAFRRNLPRWINYGANKPLLTAKCWHPDRHFLEGSPFLRNSLRAFCILLRANKKHTKGEICTIDSVKKTGRFINSGFRNWHRKEQSSLWLLIVMALKLFGHGIGILIHCPGNILLGNLHLNLHNYIFSKTDKKPYIRSCNMQ